MRSQMCQFCEDYKKQGHNYCRMCGYHLTKGYVQYAKLATAYYNNEKYCGYCGGPKNSCKCVRHTSNNM
jgi:hypothetical protein